MIGTPRILVVTAQPGDESWAFGAVLARYVSDGARIHLVCATAGEGASFGASRGAFPPAVLGRMREREMEAAAGVIGIHETELLGLPHGRIGSIDPFKLQMDLAARIRRARPHVVLTFGPQGPGGDPDRHALAEATQAAVHAAARHSAPVPGGLAPHAVRKVYQRVWSGEAARPAPSPSSPFSAGLTREPELPPATPVWMVTTAVSTDGYEEIARKAIACHRSRGFASPGPLAGSAPQAAWPPAEFVRTLSTVGTVGGPEVDLLAGIPRGEARSVRAA